jgi:catechol 2,3-dioxygenase-like lactoylglutathione lyase family enzyme
LRTTLAGAGRAFTEELGMAEDTGLRAYAFVLAVPDLPSTVGYFVDVLGFRREWADGENWQTVSRDGVRLMIGHCPDAMSPTEIGDHSYFAYWHSDDIDRLHDEIAPRGAIIRQRPTDKPWGMREMAIATPDGHRIMVGQRILSD